MHFKLTKAYIKVYQQSVSSEYPWVMLQFLHCHRCLDTQN